MNFDQWWDDDEAGEPAADLPLCADGTHFGEVTKAEWRDLKFKASERNPSGTSLVLEVAVKGHQPLEVIAPAQFRWLIEAICRATSLPLPTKGQEWDCETLVGKSATFTTERDVRKNGQEFVKIVKWVKGAAPVAPATKAPKAAARPKASVPQSADSDDIPF